jgi:ABC-type Fe3+-siderophore transport system permease subunit
VKIPLDFDIRPYAKLAALGALVVSAGAFGLWLLTLFVARPTPGGGIDPTHFILSAIAVGMICAAVIAVHVVFARQLFRYAKGDGA